MNILEKIFKKREQYPLVIHPNPNAPFPIRKRWRFWRGKSTSRTIDWHPGNNELDDVSYLDDPERYPDNIDLVLSGQMADACVKRKLQALAGHPRIRNGHVKVIVDRQGTMERNPGEIDKVVSTINKDRKVKFTIK